MKKLIGIFGIVIIVLTICVFTELSIILIKKIEHEKN